MEATILKKDKKSSKESNRKIVKIFNLGFILQVIIFLIFSYLKRYRKMNDKLKKYVDF